MFDLPEMKQFKDNIHGYVYIPKLFVKHIIDTPEFQRLRNIEQTGMKVLYQAARHDRFSHSLGVFHLGAMAVNAVMLNFKREDSHWNIRSDRTKEVFWAKNKVLFLIACLLHDIGHAPFSHSLEHFYGYSDQRTEYHQLKNSLFNNEIGHWEEIDAFEVSSEHEKMSAWLILRDNSVWRSRINDIIKSLNNENYPNRDNHYDGEYEKAPPYIEAEDDDIEFIARMILGVKYTDYRPEKQIRNCFIELLNGSFDMDKLDYTMRDTTMSGINNISIDIERLLNSLTIITKTIYRDTPFEIKTEGVNPVILTRFECEASKEAPLQIKANMDRALILHDCDVSCPPGTRLRLKQASSNEEAGGIKYAHGLFDPTHGYEQGYVRVIQENEKIPSQDGRDIPVSISNDKNLDLDACVTKKAFEFETFKNIKYGLLVNSENLESTPGKTEEYVTISGIVSAEESISFHGEIKGYAKYIEVLSDELSIEDRVSRNKHTTPFPGIPRKEKYTGFSIGFKKHATSVLLNTTDARNYLYRWIYSHHKVVYYANYLLAELSKFAAHDAAKDVTITKTMHKMLNSEKMAHTLDEPFMLTKIHNGMRIYEGCENYKKLYDELISRNYRHSLYKTLVEFDYFFKDFNENIRADILRRLKEHSTFLAIDEEKNCLVEMDDKEITLDFRHRMKYGLIKNQHLNDMKHNGIKLSDIIEDILWIESNPSQKTPSPSGVYIEFAKDMITTMDRLPMMQIADIKRNAHNYFYIYYRECSEKPQALCNLSPSDIRDMLKNALYSYIRTVLFGKRT
ncbi:MAG: HD domain-containing protein [Defluviitaleaceae bacterium]|nr:HD domain-containing protein [Defluviitaleaceae bacterium]